MSCERNDRSVRMTTAPAAVRAESLRFSSSTSIRYSCPTQDLCTRPIRTSIFEIWTCDQDAPDDSKKNGRPTDGTNGWSLPKSAETLSSSETIDDRRSTIDDRERRTTRLGRGSPASSGWATNYLPAGRRLFYYEYIRCYSLYIVSFFCI